MAGFLQNKNKRIASNRSAKRTETGSLAAAAAMAIFLTACIFYQVFDKVVVDNKPYGDALGRSLTNPANKADDEIIQHGTQNLSKTFTDVTQTAGQVGASGPSPLWEYFMPSGFVQNVIQPLIISCYVRDTGPPPQADAPDPEADAAAPQPNTQDQQAYASSMNMYPTPIPTRTGVTPQDGDLTESTWLVTLQYPQQQVPQSDDPNAYKWLNWSGNVQYNVHILSGKPGGQMLARIVRITPFMYGTGVGGRGDTPAVTDFIGTYDGTNISLQGTAYKTGQEFISGTISNGWASASGNGQLRNNDNRVISISVSTWNATRQ